MPTSSPDHASWAHLRAQARRFGYLTVEQEQALLARVRRGDDTALIPLVQCHQRLIVDVAARYTRAGLDPEDLVSEGTIGLIEAVRRFEEGRDVRLSTYARWWIRARIRSFALDNRCLVRMPSSRAARRVIPLLVRREQQLTQELGRAPTRAELARSLEIDEPELDALQSAMNGHELSLETTHELALRAEAESPEQVLAWHELRAAVRGRLHALQPKLSRRERYLLAAQLGERGNHTQLGERLGVSRQRASQLMASMRARVRKQLSPEFADAL
jgi:RNA polymerase sigma factor (sigma-70 family)